jgi:hypothetical protein
MSKAESLEQGDPAPGAAKQYSPKSAKRTDGRWGAGLKLMDVDAEKRIRGEHRAAEHGETPAISAASELFTKIRAESGDFDGMISIREHKEEIVERFPGLREKLRAYEDKRKKLVTSMISQAHVDPPPVQSRPRKLRRKLGAKYLEQGDPAPGAAKQKLSQESEADWPHGKKKQAAVNASTSR